MRINQNKLKEINRKIDRNDIPSETKLRYDAKKRDYESGLNTVRDTAFDKIIDAYHDHRESQQWD